MLMLFRSFVRYGTYVFAASLTWLFAGDDNMDETFERLAQNGVRREAVPRMVVRAAPFALLRSLAFASRSDV